MKSFSKFTLISLAAAVFCAVGVEAQTVQAIRGKQAVRLAAQILGGHRVGRAQDGSLCALNFVTPQPGSLLLGVPVISEYDLVNKNIPTRIQTLGFYFVDGTFARTSANALQFKTVQSVDDEDPETGNVTHSNIDVSGFLTVARTNSGLVVTIKNGMRLSCAFDN